ncbi:MAG: type II toxin-antitoxin system PemK/MazF family toxin [Candidatus Obscuribacterales bacterium]|nr:type II toxin-antitoxin system PemK/MazF family toxin [Candidatus Obscuribacterales bacterium]
MAVSEVSPEKGEIWYVKFPNQPSDPHQPRPAIVVSADARNLYASDVMVVPITSKTFLLDTYVRVPAKEGGLPHHSVAKCDQVTTVDKILLVNGPLGGKISQLSMRRIHRGIRIALGETRVP